MAQQNPEKSIQAWLEKFQEDIRTAKDLLRSGRYTWCAFACQQAIEKYLKAAYVKQFSEIPPYTHSLLKLCKELSLELTENSLNALALIDKYYLTARYPSYKDSVNIQTRKEAQVFFKKAENVIRWLQKQLNV